MLRGSIEWQMTQVRPVRASSLSKSSSDAAISDTPSFGSILKRSAGSWQPAHQRASDFGNRLRMSSMLTR